MALVSYSDSEGSGDEGTRPITKTLSKPAVIFSAFAIDKSNPGKIRVNLDSIKQEPAITTDRDGEPAPKRVRAGNGPFTGFNAMLPAPKRNGKGSTTGDLNTNSARKVFSLKTGAEPGFSRESDAELRHFFAEQDQARQNGTETASDPHPVTTHTPAVASPPKGNPMRFKPLSVSQNVKKKKKKPLANGVQTQASSNTHEAASRPVSVQERSTSSILKPKVSLFSTGAAEIHLPQDTFDADVDEDLGAEADSESVMPNEAMTNQPLPSSNQHSLDAIASDLNLSAADRRQLFGRNGKSSDTGAINIVNFNTDHEYAANEVLRASGEQVQHNPVRAIAAGKHSLKQLVNAATTQKEALEESFATGRRNKKEAGSKYGW